MTKTEHTRAKARCEAATGGPWEDSEEAVVGECEYEQPAVWAETDSGEAQIAVIRVGLPGSAANGPFVAHARADLPAALDMLERAMAALRLVRRDCIWTDATLLDACEALIREWESAPKTGSSGRKLAPEVGESTCK